MSKSLYFHKGTNKTFEVDDAFAAKFIGLVKVEPEPEPVKTPAKPKSSKEGTK